jgi:hypothetical protein
MERESKDVSKYIRINFSYPTKLDDKRGCHVYDTETKTCTLEVMKQGYFGWRGWRIGEFRVVESYKDLSLFELDDKLDEMYIKYKNYKPANFNK